MIEHTPGPWEKYPSAPGHKELVLSRAGNGCLVASCDPGCTPDAAANAKLIAAAPDLLAACKVARGVCDESMGDTDLLHTEDDSPAACACRMLSAAIAKAEG